MAQKTVETLLSETGHKLSLSDFDDIQRLEEAAKRVSDPNANDNKEVVGCPVTLGGLVVKPVTLGVIFWLQENFDSWFPENLQRISLGWLLTLDKPIETLQSLEKPKHAIRLVKRWWAGSGWTPDQLEQAIALRFGGTEGGEDSSTDYGAMVAMLCREYGQTPSYWVNDASLEELGVLIADFMARRAEEDSSTSTSLEKRYAIFDYNNLVKAIREKWQSKK